MAAKPFTFVLDCSTLSASADMLRDLSLQVLGYVGCAEETARTTAEALATAVHEAVVSGGDALGVTFRSHAGTLDIVLSSGAREVWRVSRSIC